MPGGTTASLEALTGKVDEDSKRYNAWVERSGKEGAAHRASLAALRGALTRLEEAAATGAVEPGQVALQEMGQLAAELETRAKAMMGEATELESSFSDRVGSFKSFQSAARRSLLVLFALAASLFYLLPACAKREDVLCPEAGLAVACGLLLLGFLAEFQKRRTVGRIATRLASIYRMKGQSLEMVARLWDDLADAAGFDGAALPQLTPPCQAEEDTARLADLGASLGEQAGLCEELLRVLGATGDAAAPGAGREGDEKSAAA
eukprot:EG_transcript_19623